MESISGDITLFRLLRQHPYLSEIFAAHGMEKLADPDGIPPFLTLRSALAALAINQEVFLDHLRVRMASEGREPSVDDILAPAEHPLTVSALLPCGMKMPFGRALDAFLESHNRSHATQVRTLVEGNVNHELSFYDQIDSLTSLDQLPDIVVSADLNSFYHRPFGEAFLGKGLFHACNPRPLHPDLETLGFADPGGDFTMLSANLLVVVVCKDLLAGRTQPTSWGDLLDESFARSVVLRGDDSFFCNGVLLPFYSMFGMDGIRKLARSVSNGLHPSEMVKMIDSKSDDVPPVYVMPYFFAQKIKARQRATVLVPREGALLSPVQMLVKRTAHPDALAVADYLAGPALGQILADAHFPSTHPAVSNAAAHIPMYWLGWDFLKGNDIGALKSEIATTFQSVYAGSGGAGCGC